MERIWLKSYEQGMPAEIDLSTFQSLGELFAESVRLYRTRPAFMCMGGRLSYGELDARARDFAAYLQTVLRLPKGERIAIMLPNVLQYPVCLLGALRGGYVLVNCNPLYTSRELEYQLVDSGAKTIVILENFAHTLEKIVGNTAIRNVIVARLGDMLGFPRGGIVNVVVKYLKRKVPAWNIAGTVRFRHAMALGARAEFAPVTVCQEDLAFLQYTGGTTGRCKGAMLTHRNILANILQTRAWASTLLTTENELVVTALPLYHIFALTANCLLFLRIGANNLLITNPRDIPGLVGELARHRFTVLTGVNTLFSALLNHADFAALDFSRVKITLGGGTAVQQAIAERWHAVTGLPLIEAYGLTETSPGAIINPIRTTHFTGAVGLPIPSTDAAIRNDEGVDVPPGERGELCIRGPQVMKGYYNKPEETAEVMMADGFLRTGDIAVMDNAGYVRIVDRKKDMIIVSGFNVYPNEVEEVLAMHPGVQEAAAIGVPDEKTGEAVKAFVVRKDDALNEAQLLAFCREYLTRYKVPVRIEFRSELPKSNVGKILRRALRETV